MITIRKAVGIRDGKTMLPNTAEDMAIVISRLNRVPLTEGGRRETPIGLSGSLGRSAVIAELAVAIGAFQTLQIANRKLNAKRPDGSVDPGGKTLELLSKLAGPDPLVAEVVIFKPMDIQTDPQGSNGSLVSVDPNSVEGGGAIAAQNGERPNCPNARSGPRL